MRTFVLRNRSGKLENVDTKSNVSSYTDVLVELSRLHGTLRGQAFAEFLAKRSKLQAYVTWSAVEELIRDVRDSTFSDNQAARVAKLQAIVDVHTKWASPATATRSPRKESDMVGSSWDGKMLLQVQKESAALIAEEVRDFVKSNPRGESEQLLGGSLFVGMMPVFVESRGKYADARRVVLLRTSVPMSSPPSPLSTSTSSIQSSPPQSSSSSSSSSTASSSSSQSSNEKSSLSSSTKTISKNTLKRLSLVRSSSGSLSSSLLQGMFRVRLRHDSLVVSKEIEQEKTVDMLSIRLDMLTPGTWQAHNDSCVLEFPCVYESTPAVLFLDIKDREVFRAWSDSLRMLLTAIAKKAEDLTAKRDRILSTPVVLPPKLRAMLLQASRRKLSGSVEVQQDDAVAAAMLNWRSGSSGKSSSKSLLTASGYNIPASLGYGMPSNLGHYGVDGVDAPHDSTTSSSQEAAAEASQAAPDDISDFNLMFQRCIQNIRNTPSGPLAQETCMENFSSIIRLAEDFVASAKRYGQIIISEVYLNEKNKTIKPSSTVGGVIGGEKFIVHNILFKFAIDSHGIFGGNDEYAAKVAGLELKGLQAFMSTNTPDLCYPLMALIDYKGFRLVASSLLPISPSTLKYGSQDAGKTVVNELPELAARIEQASASLNLKLHEAGPNNITMATATDIEGHVGRDGRFYLLDFSRVFPPVTPDRDLPGSHLFRMFRPEYVRSFGLFPLCSDAYSKFTSDKAGFKEHTEEIDLATWQLLTTTIGSFTMDLIAAMEKEVAVLGTLDNFSVTRMLHSRGINVRYLGLVAMRMENHPYSLVVIAEMAARVIKHCIRGAMRQRLKILRVPNDEPFRIVVKDFLNRSFANNPESDMFWSSDMPDQLDERFDFPSSCYPPLLTSRPLKKILFDTLKVDRAKFNAKLYIFRRVEQSLGLEIPASLMKLLSTHSQIYSQRSIFNDVDIEHIGTRVKFLDIIGSAQGYVFSSLADEKSHEGLMEAAIERYERAYKSYQHALNSCPNDIVLLCNCASTMVKLYWAQKDTTVSADEYLLYNAEQYLTTAIHGNRKSALAFATYAAFLMEKDQWSQAEEQFIEALVRDPNNIETLRHYSGLLQHMDQPELAKKFVARAEEVEGLMESLAPNPNFENKFD